ncbi:MAG TPA: FoF1 ATP synthase subunit gamma [Spirochaetia bacterium]|nr:FoF1 ATP synthase subunit gamma [Spirochaetia bacterium]
MPQNLRSLKSRIRTAKNIAQLAKTLEMVSVAKIRRARGLAETVRPYAERITSLGDTALRSIAPGEFVHPYLGQLKTGTDGNRPPGGSRLLLVIGPDRGLCGPLVSNLVRRMFEEDSPDTQLITVGKRVGVTAARLAGSRLVASFPVGSRLPEYSLVYDLVLTINSHILAGRASRLDVLYTRFVSYFTQVPTLDRVLPLAASARAGEKPAPGEPESERPHTIEPDLPGLLEALLPHYLEVRLFDAVMQAYSSEHGARMVAMQNAKKNALEIADSFTLLYNKTRQERITNEILDLANTGKRE